MSIEHEQNDVAVTINGIGYAFPPQSYTQEEVGALLGLNTPIVQRLLKAPHIAKRHLFLPDVDPNTGLAYEESPETLHKKFHDGALSIGSEAINNALDAAQLKPQDVDYLMCITSTGFMVPGLSSLLSRHLGLRSNLQRSDLVGMGCNAGLNGMNPVVQWARNHPNKVALMVCCEINSATYVVDGTPRTGVVNSLFGDGAAAVILSAGLNHSDDAHDKLLPEVIDFESYCVSEHWDAMRFDWNAEHGKWSFFLSRDIPYLVGFNVDKPIDALLKRHGLNRLKIKHWIIHTGGGAVIDAIKLNLELEEHDIRHTRSVLKDYGNISSGSFLISLQYLHDEQVVKSGDCGILLTMGPGMQLEAALVQW